MKRLPSLRCMTTTILTLCRAKLARITASLTITSGNCGPISSNTLAVNPDLTFTHTSQVQSHRLISPRCIKISLPNLKSYFHNSNVSFSFSQRIQKLPPLKFLCKTNQGIRFWIPYAMLMVVVFAHSKNVASSQWKKYRLERQDSRLLPSSQPV